MNNLFIVNLLQSFLTFISFCNWKTNDIGHKVKPGHCMIWYNGFIGRIIGGKAEGAVFLFWHFCLVLNFILVQW